jgi:DNA polymerase-3 subunit delta
VAKEKKAGLTYEQICFKIKNKEFAPIYLLEGEESYYIDKIVSLLEDHVCAEHEKDFNETIVYGQDVKWADVLSMCKRFPVFAEHQLVVLKEAQTMKDFDSLAPYFDKPLESTIFVIAYKNKAIDKRKAYVKKIASNGIHFSSEKVKEYQLEKWISGYLSDQKISAAPDIVAMLSLYLGNNLHKIENEIEKITINEPGIKAITKEHVEKYIGISREYNVFELPDAILKQNKEVTFRILNYFLGNMKDAPMELVLASMYTAFIRLYKFHYTASKSDSEIASVVGISPYFVKDYRSYAQRFPLARVEEVLLLLYEFNCKNVGIQNAAERSSLLKELTTRIYFG